MAQAHDRAGLDHLYTFGDVYDTLDACNQLEGELGRLRRQHVLSDEAGMQSMHQVAAIRGRVEEYVTSTNLTPKGPRLP